MTTLVLIAGDDETREYEYNDAVAQDIDLTGCTVTAGIDYYNGSIALSATLWGAPTAGLIRIKVTAAQTASVYAKFERGAHWYVRITGPATGNELKTLIQGIVAFKTDSG